LEERLAVLTDRAAQYVRDLDAQNLVPSPKAAKRSSFPSPLHVVVRADPLASAPHYLRVYLSALAEHLGRPVGAATHCHSSLSGRLPERLIDFLSTEERSAEDRIVLIWRRLPCGVNVTATVGDVRASGEADVARLFSRLAPNALNYDDSSASNAAKVDAAIDSALSCADDDDIPAASRWLAFDDRFTAADALLWSRIQSGGPSIQAGGRKAKAWLKRAEQHPLTREKWQQ